MTCFHCAHIVNLSISSRLFFQPILANQTSPSSIIISHISRSSPAQPLPTFFLDHRLFVDTSSLLPNADSSLRRFTAILTLSHAPTTTYLGTSPPKEQQKATDKEKEQQHQQLPTPTIITIPSSATESFTQLIRTKLQPQWAHRQSLIVENGTALALSSDEWTIRIGDIKIPSRQNQGPPNIRGMLIELSHTKSAEGKSSPESGPSVTKEEEAVLREYLNSLIQGTGVQLENSHAMFRRTRIPSSSDAIKTPAEPDFALASLYMDMLRGSRG